MSLLDLSDDEMSIVDQCLRAAIDGPFFPEWEFETLMGVTREELKELAANWRAHKSREQTSDAVTSVLNNLVGYPHGEELAWNSFISVTPAVVSTLLERVLVPQEN